MLGVGQAVGYGLLLFLMKVIGRMDGCTAGVGTWYE